MQRVEVTRQLDPKAVAAVASLLSHVESADARRAVDEDRWQAMVSGRHPAHTALLAWEHGRPVGYAQVSRGLHDWVLDLAVDPNSRRPGLGIGPELARRALDVVGDAGGGGVQLWVRQPTPIDDEVAAAAGLPEHRDLYQLRRRLPTGLERRHLDLRSYRAGDADDLLAVNNRAFHWHPEQGGWDRAALAARQSEPWFDPAGLLLHEREGRLAGFCWTKVHDDDDPPIGEIHVIAVDPDFQGFGLGRDLVLAGLEHLADRGLTQAMLYVDAANAAAVGLYESMGFRRHQVDRAYRGHVEP